MALPCVPEAWRSGADGKPVRSFKGEIGRTQGKVPTDPTIPPTMLSPGGREWHDCTSTTASHIHVG
ncbi:MAG: hypothetical protein ACJ8E0_02995 [Sphingomicrobium sp.]